MKKLLIGLAFLSLTSFPARADAPLEMPSAPAAFLAPVDRQADEELTLACLADALTTNAAIRRGAVEQNPIMQPFVKSPVAVVGIELAWSWWLPRYLRRTYPNRPDLQRRYLHWVALTHAACAVSNLFQK